MTNIHFIEENDPVTAVLGILLALTGPNYNPPYDGSAQPSDGTQRNDDDLLQYQLPAGMSLKGYAEPSQSESMGTVINSLLLALAPVLSAYGFILPIFGIIIGIIEVICALLNPWSVKKAVKRLKKKWLPPLLSMFPPLAGVIIILSTLKVILSVVFFTLTVLVPMIKLLINNILSLIGAFGADGNKQQQDAIREKLASLLTELANQLGILAVLKPILDIIMAILKLTSKKPCKKKKKKKFKNAPGAEQYDLTNIDHGYSADEDDTTCCDDDVCPPLLKDPPSGSAFILPTFFADSPPKFAWRIYPLSRRSDVISLSPYMQSFKAQLDSQLDEPLNEAQFAGQSSDTSHFSVKITGKRGDAQAIILPISKINPKDGSMYVIDPTLSRMIGSITYEVITNWDMLIAHNIVALGCDPEINAVGDAVYGRFPDLETPVVDSYPETADIGEQYDDIVAQVNGKVDEIRDIVLGVVFDPVPDIATDAIIDAIADTNAKAPPYDNEVNDLNNISNDLVGTLTGYTDELKSKMNSILSKATDRVNSDFEVDKNIVKADGEDKAIVYVLPRDITGSPLLKNTPDGVTIDVSIFTDFGTLANQIEDKSNGVVTAELTSPVPGVATLTAKVNDEFISSFDGENEEIKELRVMFVSDSTMPKRRFVSKPTGNTKKHITINSGEREPGGK